MIIPFFITHAGCPHQCVFCNQKNITGQVQPENPDSILIKIKSYLPAPDTGEPAQVAFYGGSFTALPLETQVQYLDSVRPFILTGRVRNIRISTRPDCISSEILSLLKKYHVTVVELGAQSMDDNVLARSNRGHTASDTCKAAALLRNQGFTIGLQLMPGLPGDSDETFKKTVEAVTGLQPDFVRLYPALVIRGTPLEKLYASGQYTPLTLDKAASLCREAYQEFENAGIQVIRMGLQPTDELQKPDRILAGPFHPAFRQLVESSIFLDKMRLALLNRRDANTAVVFEVDPRDISLAIGQKRANIEVIKKEFGLRLVHIVGRNTSGKRGDVVLLPS
jgi:histone acetyltransferase (RNA polymerase elongator complex component)